MRACLAAWKAVCLALAASALGACPVAPASLDGALPPDASSPDASTADASLPDASVLDASVPDASAPDAATPYPATPAGPCVEATCGVGARCEVVAGLAWCVCAPTEAPGPDGGCARSTPSGASARLTLGPGASTTPASVGVNLEAGLTSQEMWEADGRWMEESLAGAGIRTVRWGYNAWAWDWEEHRPLTPPGVWSASNPTDESGMLGLEPLLRFCQRRAVTPLVIVPVAVPLDGGVDTQSWADVLARSRRLADRLVDAGLRGAALELGNEPGLQGPGRSEHVPLDLYVQRARELRRALGDGGVGLVLSSTGYDALELARRASGAFEGIDEHTYQGFPGFEAYRAEAPRPFLVAPRAPDAGQRILGEANVLWPDWGQGPMAFHLESSLVLLDGLLGAVGSGRFARIDTWPSHFATEGEQEYGLFGYTSFTERRERRLLTGPLLVHRLVNEALLRTTVPVASDVALLRAAAFEGPGRLEVLVLNLDDAPRAFELALGRPRRLASARVLMGQGALDVAPRLLPYRGLAPAASASLQDVLPPRSAVAFSLVELGDGGTSAAPALLEPPPEATAQSTVKTFTWTPAPEALSHRLLVATDATFRRPVLDVTLGPGAASHQQPWAPLPAGATFFWTVVASTAQGEVMAPTRRFTTGTPPGVRSVGAFPNGGFEDGLDFWWSSGGHLRIERGVALAGAGALRVDGPAGGVSRRLPGPVAGTTEVRLSVRFDAGAGGARAWALLDGFDAAGGSTGRSAVELSPSSTWTPVSLRWTPPVGTSRLTLGLWKEAGATLLVDEVSLLR